MPPTVCHSREWDTERGGNTGQKKNISQGETGWKDYTRKEWETEARVCFAYVPWEELWCENRGHPTTSHVVRRKPRVHARFSHVDAYCGALGNFGHVYIWALFPLYFTSFRMLFSSFLFTILIRFVFFYAALACDSLRPSREGLQTAAFAACVANIPGKPDILPQRLLGSPELRALALYALALYLQAVHVQSTE